MYCCEFGSAITTFPVALIKNPTANAGDQDLIPGWGRSPGGVNGNPPQYSYLGNPLDTAACGLQSKRSQGVGHT